MVDKKLIFIFILLFVTTNLFSSEPSLCAQGQDGFVTNFKLKDMEDREYILSDFFGKDLILFFWTSWCFRCIRELQDLEREYLGFKSRRIKLLSINVGESKKRIERFLRRYRLTFPILLDRDYKVTRQYELLGVPTYILINEKGKIKFFGHNLPKDYLEYFSKESERD